GYRVPPRLLIVQSRVRPVGGGNAVAAWATQALCNEFQVTVATLEKFTCGPLNRSFGTSLDDGDFESQIAPSSSMAAIDMMPTRGALLESNIALRWARELDRRQPFDVLLSLQNEADFGRPGIQYVHFPSW